MDELKVLDGIITDLSLCLAKLKLARVHLGLKQGNVLDSPLASGIVDVEDIAPQD